MLDLFQEIAQADAAIIEDILDAVIRRYAVLYPEWELNVFSVQKDTDEDAQIERTIRFLESLKNNP
ncbi:MAG: hypothetical protein IJN60_05255 [Oscillospiraceae bacterium]|nr:hypothetical protein [Oscillospiraceae bacterium]